MFCIDLQLTNTCDIVEEASKKEIANSYVQASPWEMLEAHGENILTFQNTIAAPIQDRCQHLLVHANE